MWILALATAMAGAPCVLLDETFVDAASSRRLRLGLSGTSVQLTDERADPPRVETRDCEAIGAGYRCGDLELQPAEGCRVAVTEGPSTVGTFERVVVRSERLTRGEIDDVVTRDWRRIRFCYQRALLARPELAGKIVIAFVIGADGRVYAASLAESTMGAPDVEGCIVERFRALRFPPTGGGGQVKVRYPFVFAPCTDRAECRRYAREVTRSQ